jgi:hypothetical protein
MTRQPTLVEAEDATVARFGRGVPMWGFEGHPRLVEVLLDAVRRGELLTREALRERLGIPPTPPGAIE